MSDNELAPIIIKKKKKVVGGGHHGGAWKVAYADFVTAMMAFFMLMWLLNATTEVQRKGVADYFNPTIPVNRISGGGDGMFGGDNIFSAETLAKNGTGAALSDPSDGENAMGDSGESSGESEDDRPGEKEEKEMEELKELLTARAGESMVSDALARHVITEVTDEGLKVEIFDLPGEPLFGEGSDVPTAILVELVGVVAPIFGLMNNEVGVNAYTSSQPIVIADNRVWDLSSARADAVRRLLETQGLPEGRVQRITGYADKKPFARNPMATRNNRIEMILIRNLR